MIPKYLAEPGIPGRFSIFVEPFFGAGAMTVWMQKYRPDIDGFVFNDIKTELIDIYRAIKNNLIVFIEKLDNLEREYLSHKNRKEFYYDLRDQYYNPPWDKTEESAVLYFLMLTSFNGIWQHNSASQGRFATPAGLLNQTESFIDKGNINEWSNFLQHAEFYDGDWSTCSGYDDAFYFLDPPYRGSCTSYGEESDDELQSSLIDFCKTEDEKHNLVFLCNRKTDDTFFEDRKGNLDIKYYDVTYTAGRRKHEEDGFSAKKAVEILLHSKTINNPTLDSFF